MVAAIEEWWKVEGSESIVKEEWECCTGGGSEPLVGSPVLGDQPKK